MHSSDTTIGENVRYFMYKYKIVYIHWFNDLSNIYIRTLIMKFDLLHSWMIFCLAGAVRDLWEARVVQLLTATRRVI